MMKRTITITAILASSIALAACDNGERSAREKQADRGAERAEAALGTASSNAEQDNIERRLRLTSQPGLIGYIILLNEAGQPIMYTSVRGKVTSGSKRLTAPEVYRPRGGNGFMTPGPSDEGAYGSSDPYIYFWTTDGQYIQWSGAYLYSNSPIRLSVQPLVVSVGAPTQAEPPRPATPPASATPANESEE